MSETTTEKPEGEKARPKHVALTVGTGPARLLHPCDGASQRLLEHASGGSNAVTRVFWDDFVVDVVEAHGWTWGIAE